jgi:hypothetical protein
MCSVLGNSIGKIDLQQHAPAIHFIWIGLWWYGAVWDCQCQNNFLSYMYLYTKITYFLNVCYYIAYKQMYITTLKLAHSFLTAKLLKKSNRSPSPEWNMKIHPVHIQHGVDMDPAEVSQSKNHVAVQKSIGLCCLVFYGCSTSSSYWKTKRDDKKRRPCNVDFIPISLSK